MEPSIEQAQPERKPAAGFFLLPRVHPPPRRGPLGQGRIAARQQHRQLMRFQRPGGLRPPVEAPLGQSLLT